MIVVLKIFFDSRFLTLHLARDYRGKQTSWLILCARARMGVCASLFLLFVVAASGVFLLFIHVHVVGLCHVLVCC